MRADGTLAIEDSRNQRVDVMPASGRDLFTVGSSGIGPGQIKSGAGIAVDSAGNIYFTDWALHRIQKFDASGHLLSTIPRHVGPRFFGQGPAGLSIDKQGNFYTVDGLSILKFSPDGSGGADGCCLVMHSLLRCRVVPRRAGARDGRQASPGRRRRFLLPHVRELVLSGTGELSALR